MKKPCIYKAVSIKTGKIYIGRTTDFERRKREHKSHAKKDGGKFHEALLQEGYENFLFTIIEYCDETQLDEKEISYIKQYRELYGEKVLNECKGGIGGKTHDIKGENNPMYGRPKTEEEKQSLSCKLKGKKKPDGFGDKVSKALKGRRKSEEAIKKRSHEITVINTKTGFIAEFPSKTRMLKKLHCDMRTLKSGKTTNSGYILIEGVEAIESAILD